MVATVVNRTSAQHSLCEGLSPPQLLQMVTKEFHISPISSHTPSMGPIDS